MLTDTQIKDFVEYVLSFYGRGGLYDLRATEKEVRRALNVRLSVIRNIEFDGDTTDRELVRDIILAMRETV